MYNFKCLSLFIISLVLVGCGGGTSTTAAPTAPTLTMSFAPTKIFRFTWVAVSGATSYKLKEAITTGSGYTLIKETTATSFDHAVPLYARLNAKYIVEGCNATGCTASTAVFTSTKVADMVSSIGYFKASNAGLNDYFGKSLSLSSDGNTLAVSALYEQSNATGINGNQADNSASYAGAVYVFTRIGTTWSQQAYLKASNTEAEDYFGFSVSLSSDGHTLAVGAADESSRATGVNGSEADNLASDAGAVYVFTRSGSTWSQQAYIKASNTDARDFFGNFVSLSPDGNTLAIAAPTEDSNATGINGNQADNSATNAGAVYVFTRSGIAWSQQAYLKASNTGIEDNFGTSLSFSSDGNTLVVSAKGESSNATGVNGDESDNSALDAGAIYVFVRSGAAWYHQAYLKASNTSASDYFGNSMSLSSDGNTLAVGISGDDSNAIGINGNEADNSLIDAGAASVFIRSGATWSQQAYLKASNTGARDYFGNSLSLSADGNTLAVGAVTESSSVTGINGDQTSNSFSSAGAVYTYTRTGTTWSQQAYLKASNTTELDRFGFRVVLSSDGGTLAVSAWGDDSSATGVNGNQTDNTVSDTGAVYVF